ncbi:MAG: CoA-binding protein [Bacteroidetes bacterium]|nr:MAG: CoA-binding protein [Bacteroidota bacterium]
MDQNKNVLLLGASLKSYRYSFTALQLLRANNHYVHAVGKEEGQAGENMVSSHLPPIEKFHTVSLYLNPKNQRDYYEKLFMYSPERVIFNPGSENEELEELCKERGVQVVKDCTIMMLKRGAF